MRGQMIIPLVQDLKQIFDKYSSYRIEDYIITLTNSYAIEIEQLYHNTPSLQKASKEEYWEELFRIIGGVTLFMGHCLEKDSQ